MENNQLTIKALCKECLNIISTATDKDNEIDMLIEAAKKDFERLGITYDDTNALHRTAIVQYVKGHFSTLDISLKELCLQTYKLLITDLQLSL